MPPKNTTRAKSTGLENRLDFEVTVDRVSYLAIEIADLANERDRAVQQAQQMHAELIAELQTEQKAKLALCEKFAKEHRADLLPGTAKSDVTPLSTWGFRTGMPQLKLLSKWTWEKAVAALQAAKRKRWLRLKVEPAKDVILAAAQANPKLALAAYGLRVWQDESFYIEAKVDSAEPIKAGGES